MCAPREFFLLRGDPGLLPCRGDPTRGDLGERRPAARAPRGDPKLLDFFGIGNACGDDGADAVVWGLSGFAEVFERTLIAFPSSSKLELIAIPS